MTGAQGHLDVQGHLATLENLESLPVVGTLTQIVGITAECRGLHVKLGEICRISKGGGGVVQAEAIGFRGDTTVLMPLSDLDGIGPGSMVSATGHRLTAPGGEALLGRVLDGIGRPQDDGAALTDARRYPVHRSAPLPRERRPIHEVCETGIRSIDALLTLGKGQRLGIFAGAGVGKSTLMGALASRSRADVTVIALVGERGREVYDFVRDSLGEDGLARSVVVAAPSDASPLQRLKAPFVATSIAESFASRGRDVLLLMDSLTRFAAAAREVGLALGEPPTAKGYPPSLFSQLPKLVERPGNFEHGSITGLYTVLVEGDDMADPVADSVRSLLDGHIVLSRNLAERGHFPAVDVLGSISRLMPNLTSPPQRAAAETCRKLLAVYRDHKDLIDVGAYQRGADPTVDRAVDRNVALDEFLRQDVAQPTPFEGTLMMLNAAVGVGE